MDRRKYGFRNFENKGQPPFVRSPHRCLRNCLPKRISLKKIKNSDIVYLCWGLHFASTGLGLSFCLQIVSALSSLSPPSLPRAGPTRRRPATGAASLLRFSIAVADAWRRRHSFNLVVRDQPAPHPAAGGRRRWRARGNGGFRPRPRSGWRTPSAWRFSRSSPAPASAAASESASAAPST
jgi:hypothetical protein